MRHRKKFKEKAIKGKCGCLREKQNFLHTRNEITYFSRTQCDKFQFWMREVEY